MRAVILAIVIVTGAAVIGRIAGALDAVPFAFFGLWAAALLSVLDRVPAEHGDDPEAAPAPEPEIKVRI